jgi:hypothetical protein
MKLYSSSTTTPTITLSYQYFSSCTTRNLIPKHIFQTPNSHKMSSDVVANPPATNPGESKSARKKKAKATIAAPSPVEKSVSDDGANGSDPAGKANGADDNSYIRELQKSVKLGATGATPTMVMLILT